MEEGGMEKREKRKYASGGARASHYMISIFGQPPLYSYNTNLNYFRIILGKL